MILRPCHVSHCLMAAPAYAAAKPKEADMAKAPTSDDKSIQLAPKSGKAKAGLEAGTPEPKKVKVAVAKAKPVAPDAAPAADAADDGPDAVFKKGEALDAIVARTDVKRSDAKAAIEAFLAELATQLQAGREMQLPPLGKIKPVKSKVVGQGATVHTIKIRQPKPE